MGRWSELDIAKRRVYLCPRPGEWSALDVSVCSLSLTHCFSWEISRNQFGSDHVPIIFPTAEN